MVRKNSLGYIVAVIVIAAATIVLRAFGDHINPTTVALAFLLIVVFLATAWGPKPAIVASLLGVACFNFFFLSGEPRRLTPQGESQRCSTASCKILSNKRVKPRP